jgi:hypothetical protein
MGAGFDLGFQRRDIPALNQTSPKLLLQISVSGEDGLNAFTERIRAFVAVQLGTRLCVVYAQKGQKPAPVAG